jgi:hypothetical protein
MSASEEPIGRFEYELTDQLAVQASTVFCQLQQFRVKKPRLRIADLWILLALTGSLSLLWITHPRRPWEIGQRRSDIMEWLPWIVFGVVVLYIELLFIFALAISILRPFIRWFIPWRNLRSVRRLAHRRVQVAIYDDRLEGLSAARETKVPWSQLRKVETVPHFWFLTLERFRVHYIPVQALSVELQALIRRKVTEGGVKFEEWALPPLQAERE